MKKLIIVRGLPGSGKSTLAKDLKVSLGCYVYHIEADMYWVRPDGRYDFVARNLKHAHDWCRCNVKAALDHFVPDYHECVVVSNTFTTLWEMQPYISMCKNVKDILIVECTGDYGNIHNVPEPAIQAMRNRWEKTVDYIDSVIYDGSNIDQVIQKIKGE